MKDWIDEILEGLVDDEFTTRKDSKESNFSVYDKYIDQDEPEEFLIERYHARFSGTRVS